MDGRLTDAVLDRALEIRQACRTAGIPDPQMFPDRAGDLLLQWEPLGIQVEMHLAVDGTVRWIDPVRPNGIIFDLFTPGPFIQRIVEWYEGGPIINGQRITLDELHEIQEERDDHG